MALYCLACKHENEDVIPGCGGHVSSLFGTPTFVAPTGETYAWIRCERCRTRFWAASDFPFVADNQYLVALTIEKSAERNEVQPQHEEAPAPHPIHQERMQSRVNPQVSEVTAFDNTEVHHG